MIDGPQARKNELAQIHIAISDLGWDDGHYRAVLFAKTGKRSAGDLDSTGRKRFIEHLKACGWTGGKPRPAAPKYTRQQWHILQLWRELGEAGALTDKSGSALNAFVAHLVGASDLRLLTATAQATTVIEALKAWLQRMRKAARSRGAST
ncbi:MAG: phage protein GemA/Gp16 family protein [Vicinamibacterales bacterium]